MNTAFDTSLCKISVRIVYIHEVRQKKRFNQVYGICFATLHQIRCKCLRKIILSNLSMLSPMKKGEKYNQYLHLDNQQQRIASRLGAAVKMVKKRTLPYIYLGLVRTTGRVAEVSALLQCSSRTHLRNSCKPISENYWL